ncbi:hypothetical protein L596_006074 [Steinernema carpocapsae]|uniref:Uncharacterized protein n=1 Tax=Steinernema carpocapsae TaxID=34508 RepID=A0A4V6YSZ6_STECR|nr:hypothetical protein L596_006074 [Steinernema carpocapsae]
MDSSVPFVGTDGGVQRLKLKWIDRFPNFWPLLTANPGISIIPLNNVTGFQLRVLAQWMEMEEYCELTDSPLWEFLESEENRKALEYMAYVFGNFALYRTVRVRKQLNDILRIM